MTLQIYIRGATQTTICPVVKMGVESIPAYAGYYRRHYTWAEHDGMTLCQIKDGKEGVEVIVETPPRGDAKSLKMNHSPCSRCEMMHEPGDPEGRPSSV